MTTTNQAPPEYGPPWTNLGRIIRGQSVPGTFQDLFDRIATALATSSGEDAAALRYARETIGGVGVTA